MISILGFSIQLPDTLEFLSNPIPAFIINLAAWALIALVTNFVILRLFKVITRRIPGDLEDIILAILNGPIIILIVLFGVWSSLNIFTLSSDTVKWVNVVNKTVLVLVIAHTIARLIKDVLVYYGEKWAARSESRADDVLLPVLNLFGPLMIGLIAALVILPLWGVNITSVLLGAGVLGLVLGLALQETLGNIFSGISILVEAPFKKGDLILMPDGRVCEVLRLGIRSTALFSLDEQATIYAPNKTIAANTLINLTKPTPEQRYSIEINVDDSRNLAQLQQAIFRIADGHPALLSSDPETKSTHIREAVKQILARAELLPAGDPARIALLLEADRNEKAIRKHELDGKFNQAVFTLKEALRELIRSIGARESNGISEAEQQELYCTYVTPAQDAVETCLKASKAWQTEPDPWINHTDHWNLRKQWEERDTQLHFHWERLKKTLQEMKSVREMRMDDSTKEMLEWLEKEYKVPPGYWKNPVVVVKSLEPAGAILQLWYYVDNIRLEHDGRPRRVRNELLQQIRDLLTQPA